MVEISPFMANLQLQTLCGKLAKRDFKTESVIDPTSHVENASFYHQAVTSDTKIPVFWYRDLMSVPKNFHFYIAHEFFDVLPIHKLQVLEESDFAKMLRCF